MRNKKELEKSGAIQRELFQGTKRLNLSETYELIPKDISATDPNINWINKDIANPVKKPFSIEEQTFVSEIIRATLEDR